MAWQPFAKCNPIYECRWNTSNIRVRGTHISIMILMLTLRDIPEINPPPHIPFCATEPHKKQSPVATHSTLLRPHFSARIFEYYIFRPFSFLFLFLSFLLFLAVLFVCLSARLMWMGAQLTKKRKKNKNKNKK